MWSAWAWVNRIASRAAPCTTAAASGDPGGVSTNSRRPSAASTTMLARVRRLRGSAGSQAPHSPAPSSPPISRHPGRSAAPEHDHAHPDQAVFRNSRRKFAVVRSARASGLMPADLGQLLGGMRGPGRLVPLAPERHRREIRRIGLHEQPVGRKIASDRPDLARFRERQDAREADMPAHLHGIFSQLPA